MFAFPESNIRLGSSYTESREERTGACQKVRRNDNELSYDVMQNDVGDQMSTISVRVSDKEDALIRKYAELHNQDLSSFVREAVMEKIEDEYDLTLFHQIWEQDERQKRFSHEELKRELGL